MPEPMIRRGKPKSRRRPSVKEDRKKIRGLRKKYGADDNSDVKMASYKRRSYK